MKIRYGWIGILIIMFGGLGYLMIENEEQVQSNIIDDVEALTKTFSTGDEITFYPQPIVENNDIELEDNNVVPLVEKTEIVNGTEVVTLEPAPEEPDSQVFVSSMDIGYKKDGDPIVAGVNDQIQIGNIVNIVGMIKLVDNLGIDIPAPHRYTIDIDCDFRDKCNLITITNRGITDTSGHFQYKLTTNQQFTEGEYVAVITATSDQTDNFGKPYLLQHQYRFWLIK